MDVVNTQMRAGRYKYAASRGECGLLDGLSAQYSKSTGRPISTQQFNNNKEQYTTTIN